MNDRDHFDDWKAEKASECANLAIKAGVSLQDVRDAAVLVDQLERALDGRSRMNRA